jgi:hypothetical protein
MAKVCQKQTGWMILSQLLLAVGVQYIVLLQKLLCDLQNLVIEGEPGILTNHAQDLRISQAAACTPHCCCWPWRQKASV